MRKIKTEEEKIQGKIHKEHRKRLQRQVFKSDIVSMSEIQILEYLLTLSIPRIDTNPLAHKLLNEFSSLHSVLDADYDSLLKVTGIGPKTAMIITSLRKIFEYCRESKKKENKAILCTPNQIYDFFSEFLDSKPNEELYMACLNAKNEVIKIEKVATGSTNTVIISPSEVSQLAIKHKASMVVLAHNHPQGEPFPSSADIEATKAIIEALNIFGIAVLDHIIIGKNAFFSFTEKGILAQIKNTIFAQKNENLGSRIISMIKN